jgi:hypothetical protein
MRRSLVPAVLLLVTACSPVSATDCISHWNQDGPHRDVAAEGYVVAEITSGENKAGPWGCGVLFHSGRGEPWRIYGAIVDGGVVGRWDSQSGSSWGTDSPEGPIDANVPVRSDGSLAKA